MMVPELQNLAQVFTERLLNTAAEGVMIAGLVWVWLRFIGRQNSGVRFAIWFSALLAIVALPFFSGSSFMASHFPTLAPANLRRPIILPGSLALCLFTVWAVGAGLLLLRLGVGLWRVHHFRRTCRNLDLLGYDPTIAGILRDFESSRRVKLCVSGGAAVPTAVGYFRPAIVFPAWLLPQLSAGEIRIILLHELAHIHRWDDWTNLAQKIVKAVFFFHPAVWWIESCLALEREMACDDFVLAQTANPGAYASSLISFAEKLQGARGLALAQALLSRTHQISQRVAQILDVNRSRHIGLWRPALGLSAVMLALVLVAAPYMPRLVAFRAELGQISTQPTAPRGRNATEPPADAGITLSVAARDAQRPRLRPQPRAISAAFHPRTVAVPPALPKAMPPRQPTVLRVSTSPEELPIQETIFILRTTQYDASGSGVLTLCVWRVGGKDPADKPLASAIFVSVI